MRCAQSAAVSSLTSLQYLENSNAPTFPGLLRAFFVEVLLTLPSALRALNAYPSHWPVFMLAHLPTPLAPLILHGGAALINLLLLLNVSKKAGQKPKKQ